MNVSALSSSSAVSYKEGMSRHTTTAGGFGNPADFKLLEETAANATPGTLRPLQMDTPAALETPETLGGGDQTLSDTINQVRDQNLVFEHGKPGSAAGSALPPGSIVNVLA